MEVALDIDDICQLIEAGAPSDLELADEWLRDEGIYVEYNVREEKWRMETCMDICGRAMVTGPWMKEYGEALADAASHYACHN